MIDRRWNFSIMIDRREREKLERLAARLGVTKGEVMRLLLEGASEESEGNDAEATRSA